MFIELHPKLKERVTPYFGPFCVLTNQSTLAHVSASKVFKIRLEHRWLQPYEAHRQALQIGDCWTTRGLAAKLGVSVRAILRQIYKQVIPPEHVHRHTESGVYLVDSYPDLLPTLQQALGL